jgi:hypothetical protein
VEDQNVAKAIENRYFRHFKRRDLVAPSGEPESAYRWRALESLVESGEPDFFEAVGVGDGIGILVVIDGSGHLVRISETEGTTLSFGPLAGGTYTERIFYGEEGLRFEGKFEHQNLPEPLILDGHQPDEFNYLKDARDLFRRAASVMPIRQLSTDE